MMARANGDPSANVQPVVKLSVAALLLPFALFSALLTKASAQQTPDPPAAPGSTVLFERHTATAPPQTAAPMVAENAASDASTVDAAALTVTAYDLDAHMTPATAQLAMRARVTLRNDGSTPLTRVVLQISSSLAWESVTSNHVRLPLTQRAVETDADHTGRATEAVITLPVPLAPRASVELDAFYTGSIAPDATRLTRIGASAAEAATADWDSISDESTALRGFGNVLWYPVVAAPVFLGDGAKMFEAVDQMKLREQGSKVHLRLTVEYAGDPPAAAFFCGRRSTFTAQSDDDAAPTASGTGVATAEFATFVLGFRGLSLFVLGHPEHAVEIAGHDAPPLITVESDADTTLLRANAIDAAALLTQWLGAQPLQSLTIIDHAGQPFQDGALLVAPLAALGSEDGVQALVYSLTHAYVATGEPWIDEGLAQFFVLLAIERSHGRAAAIAAMGDLERPLALAEPAPEVGKTMVPGQPLPDAASELYYRRKAANVWWMLRELGGDDALQSALQTWRVQPASRNNAMQDALSLEATLEKAAGKDLHWFFDDWVLHDRGLPDLVITDVSVRELPANAGRGGGWSVAVTVRNEGAASADVPIVVRSATLSTTQRVRVPALGTVTARVLIEAMPAEVVLNDGAVPEQRTSVHTRTLAGAHAKQPQN